MKLKNILTATITGAIVCSGAQAEAKKAKKSEGYMVAARYSASDHEQFPRPKKVAKTKKSKKKNPNPQKKKKH